MTLVAVPLSMAVPDWYPDPDQKGAGLRGIEAARAELARAAREHPSIGGGKPRPAACDHPRVELVDGVPWCEDCGTVIDRVELPCDADPDA